VADEPRPQRGREPALIGGVLPADRVEAVPAHHDRQGMAGGELADALVGGVAPARV
jgi:hypothetical protein